MRRERKVVIPFNNPNYFKRVLLIEKNIYYNSPIISPIEYTEIMEYFRENLINSLRVPKSYIIPIIDYPTIIKI